MKKALIILIGIVVIGLGFLVFGLNANNVVRQDSNLNTDLPQPLRGTITQIEQGKDGMQVTLQTDSLLYNVTISSIQTKVIGSLDQIQVGTEIEVSGRGLVGMEPPMIVAEQVTVLGDSNPLSDKMWLLTNYDNQPPITGHQPTLQFEIDQVSGTTGCNHFGGGYQINGESIRFDGLYSTEMACLEPEGLMEQERIYLELLRYADRYELNNGVLTIFAESNPILVFEIQSDGLVLTEPTLEPADPVSVDVVTPTTAPVFMPPQGFHQYQDPSTGISIYIPETWIVTGIIEGQYAILQSYPEDKYIGGERREEGDTKCDLNIRPPGTLMDDLLQQWRSDSMTTILSEHDITLGTGYPAKRIEADSMGRLNSVITQINEQVIVLTCFGDFAQFDAISNTLGTE